MRLLIVSSRFPYPIQKGDKLRLFNQIKTLAEHFELYLFSCSTSDVEQEDLKQLDQYCAKVFLHQLDKSDIFTNLSAAFLSGLPFQVGLYTNPSIKKEIEKIVSDHKIEHVYCQLIRMAENVKDLKIPKTIDFMDAFGFGMEQRAKQGAFFAKMLYRLEARRVRKYEKAIAPKFSGHTIITHQDRDRLHLDKANVEVIHNGVDSDFFVNKGGMEDYDLVFVGNMGYLPNVIAAKYLATEVLPALEKRTSKSYSLFIAGARPTNEVIDLTADDRVIVAGWLEDIRTAYMSGRFFVAPIFSGIGQQNKILEALSMEVPVITNRTVAEGLEIEHEKHCLIAENAEEFAECIARLETDPGLMGKLIVNGLELVKSYYPWLIQNKKLVDYIKSIHQNSGQNPSSLV